ncbi:MAG: MucB/RseB C-terminal domain-containing protein [Pseudomonadota bacterium]
MSALLLVPTSWAMAGPLQDDLNWLKTMAFAAHQTDYSGTFVYQYGNHVETSRFTHIADRDGEHSRVEGLDGARREIINSNGHVWCYLGDDRLKLEGRQERNSFPALLPQQLSLLNENYRIRQSAEGRVAGFPAHAVVFQPKDNLRYGRRMWAHVDSGLLLKTEVLDERGNVVEQYAFTQLTIGGNIDRSWIASVKQASEALGARSNSAKADKSIPSGWQVDMMPPGFRKIMEMRRHMGNKKMPVIHMVFSDGLAGISIFIEPESDDDDHPGLSSRGALQVYSKVITDHLVTVVGEVPPRTVMQVADSVRYSGP